MKIVLTIRRREESESYIKCPTSLDEEEYEMYLDALRHELSCAEGVSEVVRDESTLQVTTTAPTLTIAKGLLKPALTSRVMSELQLTSIVEV